MAVEDQITSVGSSGGGFSNASVPKGYLKCDIFVQAKGDKVFVNILILNFQHLLTRLLYFSFLHNFFKKIHKEELDKDDEIDK